MGSKELLEEELLGRRSDVFHPGAALFNLVPSVRNLEVSCSSSSSDPSSSLLEMGANNNNGPTIFQKKVCRGQGPSLPASPKLLPYCQETKDFRFRAKGSRRNSLELSTEVIIVHIDPPPPSRKQSIHAQGPFSIQEESNEAKVSSSEPKDPSKEFKGCPSCIVPFSDEENKVEDVVTPGATPPPATLSGDILAGQRMLGEKGLSKFRTKWNKVAQASLSQRSVNGRRSGGRNKISATGSSSSTSIHLNELFYSPRTNLLQIHKIPNGTTSTAFSKLHALSQQPSNADDDFLYKAWIAVPVISKKQTHRLQERERSKRRRRNCLDQYFFQPVRNLLTCSYCREQSPPTNRRRVDPTGVSRLQQPVDTSSSSSYRDNSRRRTTNDNNNNDYRNANYTKQ